MINGNAAAIAAGVATFSGGVALAEITNLPITEYGALGLLGFIVVAAIRWLPNHTKQVADLTEAIRGLTTIVNQNVNQMIEHRAEAKVLASDVIEELRKSRQNGD